MSSRAELNKAVGRGMVIAAAMIAKSDDVLASEILHAAGLTTARAMRSCGCDDYDIGQLEAVIQNIAQRERNYGRKPQQEPV